MNNALLSQKHRCEAEMLLHPGDAPIRGRYFQILEEISRTHFGPFFACLPEVATPLLFRGGTSDIWNLQQVFLRREYEVELGRPLSILDLGAYVGYTAVFFANRFPDAKIISVEPPGPNFDTLVANTIAYPQIQCLPAAAWHEHADLALEDHAYGDWGKVFIDQPATPQTATVPGLTLAEIVEMRGWDGVDLLKCSSHERVDTILRPPPSWLGKTATIINRPGAYGWLPSVEQEMRQTLSELGFEGEIRGPIAIFRRRIPNASPNSADDTLHLLPSGSERREFTLSNIDEKLNFYRYGRAAIQLTPNAMEARPAAISIQVTLDGHDRFRVRLATDDAPPGNIRFALRIVSSTGTTIVDADRSLPINAIVDWEVAFPPAWGLQTVTLSTENIAAPEGVGAQRRPAHFIDPLFVRGG